MHPATTAKNSSHKCCAAALCDVLLSLRRGYVWNTWSYFPHRLFTGGQFKEEIRLSRASENQYRACLLENLSGFFSGECLLPPTPNNLEFWGKNGRKGSFWRAQHCWVKGIEGMGPKPIKKLSFGAVLCNSNMKGFLHNFPGSFDLRCRVGMSLLLDMRLPKC